jgi:hypothetical protein
MATATESRENNKRHLASLLKIKKSNKGKVVEELQEEITDVVVVMEQEDVAYVEKIMGTRAFE